jgi:hypothetical protein
MQTDKELALELVDALEEMYYREIVYEAILNAFPETSAWHEHFDQALKNHAHREEIHGQFLPVREQVLNAPDLTSAVHKMLEGLERIDPEDSV